MARTVTLQIGINGAFLTRRWEEPESWMRLTRECGYRVHEFCGDVLDPFFSGDRDYQVRTARQVREAAARYGIHITDIYTGVATHRFHGLSHRDPSCRRRMAEWIEQCMELALEMGTDRVGGHWDAFSVEVLSDPKREKEAFARICQTFRELAAMGKRKGIAAIYNEQMYIPSEIPWTLEQAEQFLAEVNRGSAGCPVYLTVDTGHQAGQAYGLTAPDTDYTAWLRRFAPVAEIVHIQQTTPEASHHWPFTPAYNERGGVRLERILEAVEQGHREWEGNPLSAVMAPVARTFLVAELIPGSTKTEQTVLEELTISAQYLRQYVPEAGLTLSVP